MDEAQAARIRREKQEFEDAQRGYNETLNRISQGMPSPMGMQSQYSSSGGPQRAATDPWVLQNHPELAAAGKKLVQEEQEYRALDEPVSHHSQDNCSIVSYTAAKFYEYAALAEMLYALATDAEFRKSVVDKLGAGISSATSSGGWFSDLVIMSFPPQPQLFGGKQADEDFRRQMEVQREAGKRTVGRIASFFSKAWEDFKTEWHRCGLASAVTKVGIDGVFLAGEIFVGGMALKGIRFAYRVTKQGKHVVEIVSIDRGITVGAREWSKEALEGKYGPPPKNQVGGILDDLNNELPDKPATEPKPKKAEDPKPNSAAMRSKEELAPGGVIPSTKKGAFSKWWNDLTPDELDMLWKDQAIRETIEDRVRSPGGLHEWLMTGMGPKIKRMGFSMDDIKAMTTPTKEAEGRVPGSNERWRHNADEGTGSGPNSGKMHKALQEAIEGAKDRTDLLNRLKDFSYKWLDNGPNSFPPALRDLILAN